MESSFGSARPVVGRLIALDLRPTRTLTFLGPAWAALCGAVASGGLTLNGQSILFLILTLLLCDVLLGAWRALWLHADWRTALPRNLANAKVWLRAPGDLPKSFFPRTWETLSRRVRFLREVIWPLVDSEMIGMLIAGILALCIAAVLGLVPLALTGAAMAISLIEGELGVERGRGLRAVFEIVLPWLIAQSVFGAFSWLSFVFAGLFTLVYRALLGLAVDRRERWLVWNNLAQLAVVLILVASNTPVGAGVVALALLAQVLWQARFRMDYDGQSYAQHAQSYVLVSMLIAGLSLWF
jgi:hypothetical protein